MGAGGIALTAGFADTKAFPANGVRIVVATVVLALGASLTNGTRVEPVAKALAGLMLLATVFAYVPGFQRHWNAKPKHEPKGKA